MESPHRLGAVTLVALIAGAVAAKSQTQGPLPLEKASDQALSERYEPRKIEGWTVLVNRDFIADRPELAGRGLKLLELQLFQVARVLRPEILDKLRSIRIWLEEKETHIPCMSYHPNEQWLQEHGIDPRKAHCVEIANVRNFLNWSIGQPWMILHELSHGYHHQFIEGGFRNEEIQAAFEEATKARLYDSVLHFDGKVRKAYAASNAKEYFAELSEAYFGTNDQYPFVRAELRRHDPRGFAVVERAWGNVTAAARKSGAGRVAGEPRSSRSGSA